MKNLTNFPIEFINNAKITDNSNTYIIVKATNADDKQCLVKIESNVGVCEAVTAQTDSVSYSYKLSALTKNSAGNPEFNLTQMKSGRIYVSLKYPLKLHIDSSNPNKMAIIDPDGFKTRDSNYYTVYDKFEFTFNEDGLWINPTSVDFFSIPIKLSLPTSPDLKSSGFSDKRSDILASVWKEFSQSVSSNEWNKLFLNFDSGTTLRVMAPGKAMRDTGPGSNPTFASDYLANNKFGLNYIDKVWDYYKTNTIKVDCSELAGDKDFNPKLKDYVFTGQIKNDEFTFSNSGNESILSIAKPESISFFAGSVGSFDFPNHTVGAIIVRALTAAFDAGLLPADDVTLSKDYFKSKHGDFYKDSKHLGTKEGPWFDLYSKAFHNFQGQPIYTFAYDDILGQDGTLHDPNASSIGKVSVTIGDMTGITLPDPYTDSSKYTVTVNLGKNNNTVFYELKYDNQIIKPGNPVVFTNVDIPFKATFNGLEENIYVKYPIIEPYNPIADGIVIDVSKQDPLSVTINFPGPPANVMPVNAFSDLFLTTGATKCDKVKAEKASVIVIRHHQDSCDDKDPSGNDQKNLDKWQDAYGNLGRALAYYTQCNGLYPIGKIVYVAGGGKQSDGHYQTPKPMETADTIVKSLAKIYREDFFNEDSKFIESNFLKDNQVIHNLYGNSIVANYIGDNNYAGYTDITKYILKLTSDSNYKYSVLLVGDYNGLSKEARGMEVNGHDGAKKHLYEIFQDNIPGSKLATPTHWDSWYGMYSLEYSKGTPRVLEKSGSTIGQNTEEGPCIDKHTNKKQILPSNSFFYPSLSDIKINKASDHLSSFKKPVNEANSKILAAIDYDKLKQKYNSDIIEKAVNTMCSHAETFQEGDMEKLAMSHEVYSKPEQYTSSDVDYAEVCIEHGIC
jgi:hypothetical protein